IALPPLTRGRWKRTREYVHEAAGIYKIRGVIRDRCFYGVFMNIGGTHFFREGSFDIWVIGWELAVAMDEIDLQALDDGYVWHPAHDGRQPSAQYGAFFFCKKRENSTTDRRAAPYTRCPHAR